MPKEEFLKIEKDLPSTLFPSDHLRIATEFQIFYEENNFEEK